jgi:hypothetical protein
MNVALSLPNMNRSCWQIVVNYANFWSVFELVLYEDQMNFMAALRPASFKGISMTLSPRSEWSGREIDQSPPAKAEVKNS